MEVKQPEAKTLKRLSALLAGGCVLSGLLAGASVDRFVIGLPAWRHVDIQSWAEYSRNADMGNGILVYPVESIGSVFLFIGSSIVLLRSKDSFLKKAISLQVHLAGILATIGLLLTFFAGPFMLSIRKINDPVLLQYAFDQFYYWSTFRGLSQILSFFACIWALKRAFMKQLFF